MSVAIEISDERDLPIYESISILLKECNLTRGDFYRRKRSQAPLKLINLGNLNLSVSVADISTVLDEIYIGTVTTKIVCF